MIREFSIKLKPTNNKARTVFVSCMIAAFLLIMLSTLVELYHGLVSLVGMIFLVAAVTVYTKYLSVVFYYDITLDSEGTPLFLVRQTIGKRQTTLCRIGLAEIKKVEKEDRSARKAHKTPTGFRKYAYLPTLDPDVVYRLTSVSRYEKSELIIEISDELAELIRSYSLEAAQMQSQAEENEEY